MANYNKLILVGNLVRDPALRYLPNQSAVVDWGMAVNHKYKTSSGEAREETLFIDCTLFGKAGEIVNQYCKKGDQLMVDGRLQYQTWEDKQGGGKRSKHCLLVDNFQLMGNRGQSTDRSDSQERPPQRQQSRAPSQRPQQEEGGSFEESDIPFIWEGRHQQPV